jgi:hypothetical protein
MKRTALISITVTMMFSVVLTHCKKDKEPEKGNVLSKEITNIVSDSTLQKISNLGMVINKGTTPPGFVNMYKASPFTLKCTNINGDYNLGTIFSDYKFRLYDQDNINLTIKLDYVNGNESGSGLGGFISGNGSDFSIFIKVHGVSFNTSADMLQILSGTVTPEGISNFYFANYMLDDFGDPKGIWMEVGEGRVFFDADKLTPIVSSFQVETKAKNLISVSGTSKK